MTDLSAIETDREKLIDDATEWGNALWDRATKLYGQKKDAAMHTAANWAGIAPTMLWKLRYRRPRGVEVSIYNRLKAAHHRHVESVEGKLAENLLELRALPATPDRERLAADLEKFLGIAPGETPRAAAERAD